MRTKNSCLKLCMSVIHMSAGNGMIKCNKILLSGKRTKKKILWNIFSLCSSGGGGRILHLKTISVFIAVFHFLPRAGAFLSVRSDIGIKLLLWDDYWV